MVIGKNTLGEMMADISKDAKLSQKYTNHQIRKTTATAMHRQGFNLQEISHVTKHKNLDSLKHYVSGPTHKDKERYNKGLFTYVQNENKENTNKREHEIQPKQDKRPRLEANYNGENDETEKCVVPVHNIEDEEASQTKEVRPLQAMNRTQNVVNNQLRQAANMFQNANFNNCNFTFTLPQWNKNICSREHYLKRETIDIS